MYHSFDCLSDDKIPMYNIEHERVTVISQGSVYVMTDETVEIENGCFICWYIRITTDIKCCNGWLVSFSYYHLLTYHFTSL